MLKRYDVQVYFEVEDIYTENQKSEDSKDERRTSNIEHPTSNAE